MSYAAIPTQSILGYRGFGMVDSSSISTGPLCGNAKAMQQALTDLGYGPLVADGQIGSKSQAAIKAFSQANGLGSKVWPDAPFCSALKGALSAAAAPPQPADPGSPPGQPPAYSPPQQYSPPAGQPPAYAPPTGGGGGGAGWWGSQTKTTQYAIIGAAGILVLGGVAVVVMSSDAPAPHVGLKPAPVTVMSANRRRKHRRSRRNRKHG